MGTIILRLAYGNTRLEMNRGSLRSLANAHNTLWLVDTFHSRMFLLQLCAEGPRRSLLPSTSNISVALFPDDGSKKLV